jgi:hypothetical protein
MVWWVSVIGGSDGGQEEPWLVGAVTVPIKPEAGHLGLVAPVGHRLTAAEPVRRQGPDGTGGAPCSSNTNRPLPPTACGRQGF